MKLNTKNSIKNSRKLTYIFVSFSLTLFIFTIVFFINSLTLPKDSQASSDTSDNIIKEDKRNLLLIEGEIANEESFQDSRPLISSDNKSLFFCRRNYNGNIGGKEDFQDIWSATLDEKGNLIKPVNLGKTVNNLNPNGICSISPDGDEIILINEYEGGNKAPIARSKKINGEWTKPEPIFVENYYNKSQYVDFFMSYQNNVLFIAADRNGGYGDQDIYLSFPGKNGKWSKPVNIGYVINTHTAEFAPFLASDGKTLFFSSYRSGGYGESDIYVTTRLDDTWTNWSIPKNLGPDVNTPNEETYCSVSSNFENIYLESFDKLSNERNIFKIKTPLEAKPSLAPSEEEMLVSSKK